MDKDTNSIVPSSGNSWVLCKSKSRSGHVYYFNTETGDSVWNLNDAEFEKSKKVTNQSETGFRATTPESVDKPTMDFSAQSLQAFSRQSSHPITNQITQQQLANFAFSHLVNNNVPFGGIANNFNALNPLNSIPNNFTNPLSFNNVSPMYNPNVWAVPNTQQIFITPTVAPLINQTQNSMNIAYNNLHKKSGRPNISPSVSNSAGAANKFGNSTSRQSKLNFRPSNFGQRREFESNRYKFIKNRTNDLRQKLSLNRGITKSSPTKAHNFNKNKLQRISTNSNVGLDNDNSKQFKYEDTSTRLDLTSLKELISLDSNTDPWLIVVDADVLLSEFKFLNILTDSDPQCHLMLPHHVLLQMESYVSTSQDLQARRILRFITEQIRHGNVKLDEASSVSDDEDTNMLLSTCLKLSENNHMVVITVDSELLSQKDSIPLYIFTPQELKLFLNGNVNRAKLFNNKASTPISKRVVISVTNNTATDSHRPSIVTTVKNTKLHNVTVTLPEIENKRNNKPSTIVSPLKKSCIDAKDNKICTMPSLSISPPKKTFDAAIQTDMCELNTNPNTCIQLESDKRAKETKERLDVINKSVSSVQGNKSSYAASNVIKTRKIKLSRTNIIGSPKEVIKTNEKRCFKWRRRRNPSQAVKTGTENISANKADKNESQLEDELLNDNLLEDSLNEADHHNSVMNLNTSSIASSDVCFVKQNTTENVIIEETTISDIISNTVSCVDPKTIDTDQFSEELSTNNESQHMHQVDSTSMEEYLIMNCDEWVSRFTQIMEEALTVVLHHDPPFSHDSLRPPWTVHEAAQCIKMKFEDNSILADAANKFSEILFQVSDKKGTIKTNIKPFEYMEMYSYGVNLLEAIKNVVNDCEDLQIASESLQKLLTDIQNPNFNTSGLDTFADITHDQSTYVQIADDVGSKVGICHLTTDKNPSPKNYVNEKYNLRSHTKINNAVDEEEPKPKDITFVRNLDKKSRFFSNLNLKKNDENVTKSVECETVSIDARQGQDECIESPEAKPISQTSYGNVKEGAVQNIVANEPKIIRNFSKCAEFEKRLKSKGLFKCNESEDILDYEEDCCTSVGDYEDEYEKDEEVDENMESEINCSKAIETTLNEEDSVKKFKYVIGMILQEIREAFLAVQNLCEKYVEGAKNPQGSKRNKLELKTKLKAAEFHVSNLYNSLNCMLKRDTTDPNNNIEAVLRRSGFSRFHIDEKLRGEYTNIIASCKNHARVFVDGIQNLIRAELHNSS